MSDNTTEHLAQGLEMKQCDEESDKEDVKSKMTPVKADDTRAPDQTPKRKTYKKRRLADTHQGPGKVGIWQTLHLLPPIDVNEYPRIRHQYVEDCAEWKKNPAAALCGQRLCKAFQESLECLLHICQLIWEQELSATTFQACSASSIDRHFTSSVVPMKLICHLTQWFLPFQSTSSHFNATGPPIVSGCSIRNPKRHGEFVVTLGIYRHSDVSSLRPDQWTLKSLHESNVRVDRHDEIFAKAKDLARDFQILIQNQDL